MHHIIESVNLLTAHRKNPLTQLVSFLLPLLWHRLDGESLSVLGFCSALRAHAPPTMAQGLKEQMAIYARVNTDG